MADQMNLEFLANQLSRARALRTFSERMFDQVADELGLPSESGLTDSPREQLYQRAFDSALDEVPPLITEETLSAYVQSIAPADDGDSLEESEAAADAPGVRELTAA